MTAENASREAASDDDVRVRFDEFVATLDLLGDSSPERTRRIVAQHLAQALPAHSVRVCTYTDAHAALCATRRPTRLTQPIESLAKQFTLIISVPDLQIWRNGALATRLNNSSNRREMLFTLIRAAYESVSYEDLTTKAWGYDYDPGRHSNLLSTTAYRLRSLVDPATIECVRSVGFRFIPSANFLFIDNTLCVGESPHVL